MDAPHQSVRMKVHRHCEPFAFGALSPFDLPPAPRTFARPDLPSLSILLCRLISVECGLYNGGTERGGRHRTEQKHTREGTNAFLLSFPAMIGMPTLCLILRSRISPDDKKGGRERSPASKTFFFPESNVDRHKILFLSQETPTN